MRLIQTRVRCVQGVVDSGWFVPGRETTVVFGPPGSGKSALFKALETLNPLYDIQQYKPLADHPDIWHQGPYTRKVIPGKKTAVFMVFAAEPALVLELEKIDPDLLETDRIEVGRKLDCSRWTTFVEIPASIRWSDIDADMHTLRATLASHGDLPEAAVQDAIFTELRGPDRLKGTAAEACLHWLQAIGPFVGSTDRDRYRRCLFGVGRSARFRQAIQQVAEWLPHTLHLRPDHKLQLSYSFSELFFSRQNQPFEPIVSLLRALWEKYQRHGVMGGKEALAGAMERVAPSLRVFEEAGLGKPFFWWDTERIFIKGITLRNDLDERLCLIAVSGLLAELAYGQKPLLLLDRFDHGFSPDKVVEIVRCQQRIGTVYQLLTATENDAVACASGWQARMRVGAGGLTAAKLEVASPCRMEHR